MLATTPDEMSFAKRDGLNHRSSGCAMVVSLHQALRMRAGVRARHRRRLGRFLLAKLGPLPGGRFLRTRQGVPAAREGRLGAGCLVRLGHAVKLSSSVAIPLTIPRGIA